MQISIPFSGLTIPSSFELQVGFEVKSVTVYNNTPAQLALAGNIPGNGPGFPYGAIIIPAFYPITVPVQGWRSIGYVTDGTAMFSGSSLLIIANDSPAGGNPLSPFGPSGWGAGAGPALLAAINPGDPILAWQVNQLITRMQAAVTRTDIVPPITTTVSGVGDGIQTVSLSGLIGTPTHAQGYAQIQVGPVGLTLGIGKAPGVVGSFSQAVVQQVVNGFTTGYFDALLVGGAISLAITGSGGGAWTVIFRTISEDQSLA